MSMRELTRGEANACELCLALNGRAAATAPHQELKRLNRKLDDRNHQLFECGECQTVLLRDAEPFGSGWLISVLGEDEED